MKLKLLQIGKTKEKAYQAIEEEFRKRLGAFCDLEIVTVKTTDRATENTALQDKILKWKADHTIVALDKSGRGFSSEAWSAWLVRQRDHKGGKVALVIGGPQGLTPETLALADERVSFSKMTFTHQMIRLFLLEQLYRGFMIEAGKKYHY